MAGSHRNDDGPMRALDPRQLALLVLAVVAIVGFGWWAGSNLGLVGNTSPDGGAETPSATPTVSPKGSTPSAKPSLKSPTSSPSAEVPPIDDLPSVSEEAPRRLVIEGLVDSGFDRAVPQSTPELEAGSASELARLEPRGRPGSPGSDTVVILGQDRFDRSAALNDISEVDKGDEIALETYNAGLTYTVQRVLELGSTALLTDKTFTEEVPGRLLLIATTYDTDGNRTGTDTVVVAQLSAASAL